VVDREGGTSEGAGAAEPAAAGGVVGLSLVTPHSHSGRLRTRHLARWPVAAATCLLLAVTGCERAVAAKPRTSQPQSMLAPLPEHRGLATRYPGDKGLVGDPAVVFADDFESSASGQLPRGRPAEQPTTWNSPWDRIWGGPSIVDTPDHVHAGQRSLELYRNRPGAVGVLKSLNPSFDRLFLRYYIKFDAAFPGAHHLGGSMRARAPGLPDANPGVVPDGTNQFSVALDQYPRSARPPGHLVAYVYHMDQRHKWGEQFYPSGRTRPPTNGLRGIFGSSFLRRRDFVPERGRWYCYEFMVSANTSGQHDGRVAFWVDGQLAGDFPNLRFRTVDELKINRVQISMFLGRRNNGPHYVWIDDVVIATAYIGPRTLDRRSGPQTSWP
jgi:hypothetical protein